MKGQSVLAGVGVGGRGIIKKESDDAWVEENTTRVIEAARTMVFIRSILKEVALDPQRRAGSHAGGCRPRFLGVHFRCS